MSGMDRVTEATGRPDNVTSARRSATGRPAGLARPVALGPRLSIPLRGASSVKTRVGARFARL